MGRDSTRTKKVDIRYSVYLPFDPAKKGKQSRHILFVGWRGGAVSIKNPVSVAASANPVQDFWPVCIATR